MHPEERTFDVFLRRQFRIGNFKLSMDPGGFGYQPRAILRTSATGLSLTRVNSRGKPIQGTSVFPRSWTWRWGQVVGAQSFVVGYMGWGFPPTQFGLRLDIHGESFYPLLATNQLDALAEVLQVHGVAVDRTPKKLNWYLTGRR
jgi:hypothetical protein